jgi:hypothetical protein
MISRDRIAVATSRRYSPVVETHDDRRWAHRRSGIFPGYIIAENLQATVSCVARDMSSTGALLELIIDRYSIIATAEGLPNTFRLVLRRDNAEVDCHVAWRNERRLGVRFVGAMRMLPKKPVPIKLIKKR